MIKKDFSLKPYNTLKLDVQAQYFAEVQTVTELKKLLANIFSATNRILILGGGSNIIFSENYRGLVIKVGIKGREVVYEDDESVHLAIGAGEDWPSLVEYVVSQGWGGIENLALVPGTAGAAPIQNIACYGHNLHETLLSVRAIDIATNKEIELSAAECKLGYRTSIFKTQLSGKCVIVQIILKLRKQPTPNTSYTSRYDSIEGELTKITSKPYKVKDIYQAVVNIRLRKLPRVGETGTVGSVFKNPLISRSKYNKLKTICPEIHCYPKDHLHYDKNQRDQDHPDKLVKIPAAWLIDEMGWAGKRIGNCGVWKTQPLNLVNLGNSSPSEYLSFMKLIQKAVYEKYTVRLEPEVVII